MFSSFLKYGNSTIFWVARLAPLIILWIKTFVVVGWIFFKNLLFFKSLPYFSSSYSNKVYRTNSNSYSTIYHKCVAKSRLRGALRKSLSRITAGCISRAPWYIQVLKFLRCIAYLIEPKRKTSFLHDNVALAPWNSWRSLLCTGL